MRMLAGLALVLLLHLAVHGQVSVPKKNEQSSKPSSLEFTKISICKALSAPEHFDAKAVEIHARFSATWEGAWISDTDCEDGGELVPPFQRGMDKSYADVQRRVAKQFGIRDVVRDDAWHQFNDATRQLNTGLAKVLPDGTREQGQYDYVTADFRGVLVMKRDFHVRNGFGNGWGHLGMSRFLLVLRSVSNVSPHTL